MSKVALTCFGGVGAVTGANFMLEVDGAKYLVDCGLAQGVDARPLDEKFEYDPREIKALFVTHAHVDHIGRIPRLILAGFKGKIFSTPETKAITELMLQDLVQIEGLDSHLVGASLELWESVNYHERKDFNGFSIEIFDSGHILGSGMFKFTFPSGESMLFTGDLGNSPSPLLKDTERMSGIKYLLMESVYGDRNHLSPEERDKQFKDLISSIVERKRTLIVPIFSLERAQLMLYELHQLYEEGVIKGVPVFLDSPLAIRITDLYERLTNKKVFDFPMLRETFEARDSKDIYKTPSPKIILAGSGMSTAGRILFHEERYLPDPLASILFIGFQAPGTLGRQIQEGVKTVEIHDKKIPVRAEVTNITGYSAHAGSDQLVNFVSHTAKSLKNIFVTMGEPKSSTFLAQRLHDELGVNAIVPERGKRYELDL